MRWLPARKRGKAPPPTPEAERENEVTVDMAAIQRIREIRGKRNGDLLRRIVEQFAELAPTLAATIREKAAAADLEAVWRAAHSLKSSASAVGARQLAHQCNEIETTARDSGVGPSKSRIDALDSEIAAVLRILQELS